MGTKKSLDFARILSIDPGTQHSAYLIWTPATETAHERDIIDNELLIKTIPSMTYHYAVVEGIQPLGQRVGWDVIKTAYFVGRLIQLLHPTIVYRSDIKMHFCHTMRGVNDAAIRQVLIDRYGPPGTKKNPGKTYGFKADLWSALAIATYFYDKMRKSLINEGRR